MAAVCVALHIAPSDYWAMKPYERDAVVKRINANYRKGSD